MRAMPTFQIYKQRQMVEEIVGADVGKLETLLGQCNASSSPFTGQGRKLSGANAASVADHLQRWSTALQPLPRTLVRPY